MIKIVTDSTAYLSEEMVREHDIRVVPLYVHFGEETFREGVQLSNEEFYARLKEAPQLPTTSQPSAGEFHQVFEELLGAGHEILVLTISSKLSGTYNSATAAKGMLPDAGITVVDSLSTAVGLRLMVEAALDAVQAGSTREEIEAELEGIKERLHLLFVVDTLEYLAKGGRIGNAKAFLGTMLKIKPILFVSEGAIEPLEQVRSKRKALTRMVELLEERLGDDACRAKAAVIHSLVPSEAQAFADALAKEMGCRPPELSDLGPVIGTHTGPGAIAVAAYV